MRRFGRVDLVFERKLVIWVMLGRSSGLKVFFFRYCRGVCKEVIIVAGELNCGR